MRGGQSEMFIEGFLNIPRTDAWSFFGVSLDYENGVGTIYLKVYNEIDAVPMQKSFSIEYNNFNLKAQSRLVIAGVE